MLEIIKNNLWTLPCSLFILVLGALILFKTKFYLLTNFPKILTSTVGKIKNQKKAFRMMCTSLGGTIGVGNAIGVAGAIVEGGAGAVFWMAVASVFSIAIKYAEIYLAVLYKDKTKAIGPLSYIEKGAKSKFFAVFYALLCILVSLGMGNLSQAKAALWASKDVIPIPTLLLSLILSFIFLVTALGGLEKISSFSQKVVPLLSICYVGLLFIILFKSREKLPFALSQIIHSSGIFSGIKWAVIKKGICGGFSKAVFSSEAGLGSAGFSHSQTDENPESQAKWGVVEVFVDALICIMTALSILCVGELPKTSDVSLITKGIFFINFGFFGEIFFALSMIFFALSSVLCWYYIGISAIDYIVYSPFIKGFYTFVFALLIILAAFISDSVIFDLSDIANALMMLVNIPAVFILLKKIKTD